MKIIIGSDHAGYELKGKIKEYLAGLGISCDDVGPDKFDPSDDYPDFIATAAREVARNPGSRGIVIGGSGQGEAIAANKIRGIRASVYYGGPLDIVRLSRMHNDANVLSLGARFLGRDEAMRAVKVWLETPFSGEERHKRRILKIGKLEKTG
ncbi:MAG: RpiB/LacA/LacB family sugar-phosphate isomerase [Candidatus Aenigmarchaeota archaeon]|nr:RpiB/LacA/LacB family sugar-phosphate isomerase [Candidatus Aenigmarchaeota archaeon]